ncbi:uncharacterized protein BCR38DRAFT_487044 [Pseudomassariella vexata]|uniref:Uncharacterized protein n=1 Tax=Pseudomassariella vexata TaxID=1141098 RepID=A0A1Y2DPV6_9PEZI|nr:uncharacterized protein BCR38DRAFT_487044 [Pseudomassariella vexata]ORY61290.1 hypothetical protein BCR38DRAFT_487044 [Pseudomassariella vexata]
MSREGLIAAIFKDKGDYASKDHYLLKDTHASMENKFVWVGASVDPPVVPGESHITISMIGMKPNARGLVSIASKYPADALLLGVLRIGSAFGTLEYAATFTNEVNRWRISGQATQEQP